MDMSALAVAPGGNRVIGIASEWLLLAESRHRLVPITPAAIAVQMGSAFCGCIRLNLAIVYAAPSYSSDADSLAASSMAEIHSSRFCLFEKLIPREPNFPCINNFFPA